jgi:hypothetical protein
MFASVSAAGLGFEDDIAIIKIFPESAGLGNPFSFNHQLGDKP